jgi:DNA-binding LacI/PurR family transcriptional regulator
VPLDLSDPAPLYRQVVSDLKRQIAAGELAAGARLPGQPQLADRYGVSLITIKKALFTLILEGALRSRVGKGTFVADGARAPGMALQATIGFVLRDLESPFFSRIARGVEETASGRGLQVLLASSRDEADKEEAQIAHLRRLGVGGLVIASMSHVYRATPVMRAMQREKFPFVMVSYVEDDDIPFVGTDHESGGILATTHLLRRGYRRIGFINGERGNLVGDLRAAGYARALREHGLRVEKRHVFRLRLKGEWNDLRSGAEIGAAFARLPAGQRPDAMFVYNDLAALGFQQAVLERGLRVPGDVAIVGFDDIEAGRYAPVPLTTVQQPTALIGERAVRMLADAMAGKTVARRVTLRPSLVARESSGGAAQEKEKGRDGLS